MHGRMVDLWRYRATSVERNFIHRIKAPIFLESFSDRDKIIVKNSVTFSHSDFLGFLREKFGYLRVTLSNLNEIED